MLPDDPSNPNQLSDAVNSGFGKRWEMMLPNTRNVRIFWPRMTLRTTVLVEPLLEVCSTLPLLDLNFFATLRVTFS